MGEQLKIQILGNVNRIVQENLEDINNTALKEVYRNADRCVYEIISEKQNYYAKNNRRDEQVANVISFLGKRGRGKTSAMLSFHTYLENISERNIQEWSELQYLDNKKVVFHTVDYIDAAMLAENEFVIDVILAKMWDKFDELLSKPYRSDKSNYDYLVKKVQDEFVNVRQAYLTMKYRENNFAKEIERERDIPAARGLHELATGINLKDSMKKLVENYIQVFNNTSKDFNDKNGYLVLAIDDVDMANNKAWNILEQIRMYMSIPNVIILLTSDMGRLRESCEISQDKKLPPNMISEFVNDYLEKVLPMSMRISMPELMDNQTDICIEKDDSFQWKSELEKDIILELIGENTGICFAEKRRKRHFMQNESLRGLVNRLNKMSSLKKGDYATWLKSDLQERLIERVKDKDDKLFLRGLFNKDYVDINNYVINYLYAKNAINEKVYPMEYSMGQVMYICSLLEAKEENINLVNCILLFYSLILNENMDSPETFKKIIGSSVLGGWEYAALSGIAERDSNPGPIESRAALQFEKEDLTAIGVVKYFENILKNEKKQILAWLYAMSYLDIDVPSNQLFEFQISKDKKNQTVTSGPNEATQSTPQAVSNSTSSASASDAAGSVSKEPSQSVQEQGESQEEVWVVKPYISCRKGIFSFVCKDLSEYRKALTLLLECAITEFYNHLVETYNLNYNEDELRGITEKGMSIIDEIKWGNGTDNRKLIMGTEILYSLGQMIEVETQIRDKEKTGQMDKLCTAYYNVYQYLSDTDKYYSETLGINTTLADNFINSMQVRILLIENEIDEDIKNVLNDYLFKIYRGKNVTVQNKVFKSNRTWKTIDLEIKGN